MAEPSMLRFRPASGPVPNLPLGRYLPPVPAGMLRAWLADNVEPGSWLLDPLGASPLAAIEAARAGYRVIVASNNPIITFLIETLAAVPSRDELQSALAELAMLRRNDERLERHLQSLYLTHCAVCGEPVPAEAFLWRRGESQPYARLYRCPRCDAGLERAPEREIGPSDVDRLDLPGSDALHRARALQRVVLSDDEYREDVEEALGSYLPRPLYFLFTILNKIEGAGFSPERLRLLQALMINLLDAGSALWPHPGWRARPRQLITPPQFREANLWLALEESAAAWAAWNEQEPDGAARRPVAVSHWPNLPDPARPGGAIVLFRGRVKALVPLPETLAPKAIISAFPRPNQAFWTLSALWSGWLWGREAALPLRNVLDRRRYDWNWHTTALHSALAVLSKGVPPGTPFFGLLPDLAPGFLNAAVIAAAAGGFALEGLAMRVEGELAQAVWRPRPAGPPLERWDEVAVRTALRDAMRADLLARGEPAPYLTLAAAGLQTLASGAWITEAAPGALPGDLFTRLQTVLARAFSDRSLLKVNPGRPDATPAKKADPSAQAELAPAQGEDERSWWWLAGAPGLSVGNGRETGEPPSEALPLSDRIEMEVIRCLTRSPQCPTSELEQALYARFCGLQTPSSELVRMILDSYGEPVGSLTAAGRPGQWRLRAGETPALRRADLQEARELLLSLGRRLGYTVQAEGDTLVTWHELSGKGHDAWRFALMASSIASRYVLAPAEDDARRVLVLPGGRARLLAYKLRRDPRLAAALSRWQILKFRHLRQIATREMLERSSWLALLAEDPLTDDAAQIKLI